MTICAAVKKPQGNVLVEKTCQVIYNRLVTKNLSNKLCKYICPWGYIISSISQRIRDSYQHTLKSTPGQDVFGGDMIFNLTSTIEWQVITTQKRWQVDIDNAIQNYTRVRHEYILENLVHVDNNFIYRKLYYKKADHMKPFQSSHMVKFDFIGTKSMNTSIRMNRA